MKCASAELQADKEVGLGAVAPAERALKFASSELKNDKEVALTAVSKQGGCAGICLGLAQAQTYFVAKSSAKNYTFFASEIRRKITLFEAFRK
jgi:hypothetical protein